MHPICKDFMEHTNEYLLSDLAETILYYIEKVHRFNHVPLEGIPVFEGARKMLTRPHPYQQMLAHLNEFSLRELHIFGKEMRGGWPRAKVFERIDELESGTSGSLNEAEAREEIRSIAVEWTERQEKRDREMYEELKAKFEKKENA